MKCLSVRQPWSELIASGKKLVENRTWRTAYRGPLLIHAAKAKGDDLAFAVRLGHPLAGPLEYGAIVAVCDLADCLDHADARRRPFAEGPVCWILTNVRRLKPFACKGALSLWQPPEGFKLTLADGETP